MNKEQLLKVENLHVSVGDKEILHGVDLTVGRDEIHVLMGPNGTGKSTLGYAVTGNPAYRPKDASCLTEKTLRICRSTSAQSAAFSSRSRIRWRCRA